MTLPHADVKAFFHADTGSVQYVVRDPASTAAAIIDPVLDFEPRSAATATTAADELADHVRDQGLEVAWVLDTHPHADHFSAVPYLAEMFHAPSAIGEHVVQVQRLWRDLYNLPDFPADGSQWDRLFAAGDTFDVGNLRGRVMHSPGHTLASVTYVIGDAAFVHDSLFMPDFGSARADFPGGDAGDLYRSIQSLLALPDDMRLFTGHDYKPGGREPRWETTVGEQKASNIHFRDNPDEAAFVAMREARDRELPLPRLMLAALQVNIRGGRLPAPESNDTAYLKIPLNRF